MTELDAWAALQKENARLLALLEANGIKWRLVPEAEVDQPSPLGLESSRLSADDKIALFRRVLLATGRLVGEGFDHPPLDTLMLAMPISWKGTLQQYAGRLHREHASKTDVLIYDYVDTGNLALERMWDKRQRGYRAMGYQIDTTQGKLC